MEKLRTDFENDERYFAEDVNLTNETINEIEDVLSTITFEYLTETTYNELKELRDSGELVPGMQYRITDYTCLTVKEDTKSANNQYDIVVPAIDEKTLSNDAKAMHHVSEEPEHEVEKVTRVKYVVDASVIGLGDVYGFAVRNSMIDGMNHSPIETMANCQIGWCITLESTDFSRFDSASTFDNVESWKEYNGLFLFSETEDITTGGTIYCDMTYFLGDTYCGEFTVLDTQTETLTVGGDYFKNCNLDVWDLKYSIDDLGLFEWVDTTPKILIEEYWLPRKSSYDSIGSTIICAPNVNLIRYPDNDIEIDGTQYYAYADADDMYIHLLANHETPVAGDDFYLYEFSEGTLTYSFTYSDDMMNTKTTAWLGDLDGDKVIAFTNNEPSIGESPVFCYEVTSGVILPISGGGMVKVANIFDIRDKFKGVVYYMTDEWNNTRPYDFKNILFNRYPLGISGDGNTDIPEDLKYNSSTNDFNLCYSPIEIENSRNGVNEYVYTFALKDISTDKWFDASVAASNAKTDGTANFVVCRDNKITGVPNINIDGDIIPNNQKMILNNVVFLNVYYASDSRVVLPCYCVSNKINDCLNGTFGPWAGGNTLSNSAYFAYGQECSFNHESNLIGKFYGNSRKNVAPISTNLFSSVWKGTQTEYDNLYYHDNNTLYIITSDVS